jgi:hypothetical protein
MGAPGELSRAVRRDATGRRARRCMVLRPAPFNFTELFDEGRSDAGLPPRQYWIEATIGLRIPSICWAGLKLIGPT